MAASLEGIAFGKFFDEPIVRATGGRPERSLLLIRHAQQIPPEERNREDLVDPRLSPLGYRQAALLAEHVTSRYELDGLFSSPLLRAHNTAEAIASLVPAKAITVIPDFREIQLLQKLPADLLLKDALSAEAWEAAGDKFAQFGCWDAFPFSESGVELRIRAMRALDSVLDVTSGNIAICTHGGLINAVIAELFGSTRDYSIRLWHCSITWIDVCENRLVLRSVNELGHLSSDLMTTLAAT